MKIALDAMGGDNAPKSNILGVKKFLNSNPNVRVILVGDGVGKVLFILYFSFPLIMFVLDLIGNPNENINIIKQLIKKQIKENAALFWQGTQENLQAIKPSVKPLIVKL